MDASSLPPTFREHPDWPGYGADEEGNVWSNLRLRRPRKLMFQLGDYKAACLTLRRDGESHTIMVAPFVLEIFVGPRPDFMIPHYRDGNKLNLRPANLFWGRHPGFTGRYIKGKRIAERLSDAAVRDIRERRKKGETLLSFAARHNVAYAYISQIANGRRRKDVV